MRAELAYPQIRPRTRRLGHSLVCLAETPSTMLVARERAEAGAAEGLVVVAERQTSGVGRRGHAWVSVGRSLHATILLRPDRAGSELGLLPLVVGVAACAAARRLLRVDLRLKWPNDLLHGALKCGGILVDAVYAGREAPEFVLAGLGVNGDVRRAEFPDALKLTATSLSEAAGRHVCLPAYLKILLEELEPRYDALASGETALVWREARGLLQTLGRRVSVHTDRGSLEGLAIDLGPEGELMVRGHDAVHAVRSGECRELRPA